MSVGFAGLGHGVLAVPVPSSGLGNDPVVVSGYRSRTGTVAAERTQRLAPVPGGSRFLWRTPLEALLSRPARGPMSSAPILPGGPGAQTRSGPSQLAHQIPPAERDRPKRTSYR